MRTVAVMSLRRVEIGMMMIHNLTLVLCSPGIRRFSVRISMFDHVVLVVRMCSSRIVRAVGMMTATATATSTSTVTAWIADGGPAG